MTAPAAFDVIIAGAGAMGAAAADHLARRGRRVLVLERHHLGHTFGSSHGLTRIIRHAYFEHPSYVPLVRRATVLWRDLEAHVGAPLLHVTGGLDIGTEASTVVAGSLESCRAHGLPHEVLRPGQVQARFPGWRLPEGFVAVHQPDAGFLLAEPAVGAFVDRARQAGAFVHTGEPVLAWSPGAGLVRVRTPRATYEAGQFVVAAGAWVGKLLPDLAPALVPERQVLGWFAAGPSANFAPETFPVFVLEGPEGLFYGFPEYGVPGVKVGKYHHRDEVVDPDRVDRTLAADDEAVLREVLAGYLPEANGALLSSTVCLFTNTADGHFLIDRHPAAPEVLVVSPCSGHGFKFSPVIGEIVADLVERDTTDHDIALFRLKRPHPV